MQKYVRLKCILMISTTILYVTEKNWKQPKWSLTKPSSCIGEGNDNPLQYSCLENPRDGEAWWAAVYGVAQSRTQKKWLSSSSSSLTKGFPSGSGGKVSACNAGDPGLIPGLGRDSGKGNGNPLQYSCLENPMDRGAWWVKLVMKLLLGQLVLSHDRKKKDLYIHFERYSYYWIPS